MPLSGGMAEKNASNAANPPAEAPMPTTGKGADAGTGAGATGAAASVVDAAGIAFDFLRAVMNEPQQACTRHAARGLMVSDTTYRGRGNFSALGK